MASFGVLAPLQPLPCPPRAGASERVCKRDRAAGNCFFSVSCSTRNFSPSEWGVCGFGWEDICGKSGPLVSPEIFRKYVAPGYIKMRAKLEEYGIKLLGIDSDGFVEPLIKDWLDAGVNIHFPIEMGTWNADSMTLRKKFGKELRIIGGYNKLALEKGRKAIDEELKRRIPIMKDGGFVLMPDHLITPGVPLDDYKYYLQKVRELRL